jgi:hypothetical protein
VISRADGFHQLTPILKKNTKHSRAGGTTHHRRLMILKKGCHKPAKVVCCFDLETQKKFYNLYNLQTVNTPIVGYFVPAYGNSGKGLKGCSGCNKNS